MVVATIESVSLMDHVTHDPFVTLTLRKILDALFSPIGEKLELIRAAFYLGRTSS